MTKPQSAAVLRLLRTYPEGVTPRDALRELACFRLAARISDLKADGFAIRSELETVNGARFARYFLDEAPVQKVLW